MTRSALQEFAVHFLPYLPVAFPAAEPASGARGGDVVLQLSTWTQDPETFQGPQRTWLRRPGLLPSFDTAMLCVHTEATMTRGAGQEPGPGDGREGKSIRGPASGSILQALGGPPLELTEGTCLGQHPLGITGSPSQAVFMRTTQIIWGPKEKVS